MADSDKKNLSSDDPLSPEQKEILDLYIQTLDTFYEDLKASEKLQIEIETEHLKKVLDL